MVAVYQRMPAVLTPTATQSLPVVQVGGPFQLRDLPPPPTEEEAEDDDEEEAEAEAVRFVVSGVSYSCLP
eukprot:COSAG01_NODE_5604_length_4152_cov_2.350851_3_plen_70_part_00